MLLTICNVTLIIHGIDRLTFLFMMGKLDVIQWLEYYFHMLGVINSSQIVGRTY